MPKSSSTPQWRTAEWPLENQKQRANRMESSFERLLLDSVKQICDILRRKYLLVLEAADGQLVVDGESQLARRVLATVPEEEEEAPEEEETLHSGPEQPRIPT